MPAVERARLLFVVQPLLALLVVADAQVVHPDFRRLAAGGDLAGRAHDLLPVAAVDVDGREVGHAAVAVHDHAEVLVFQLVRIVVGAGFEVLGR